MPRPALSALALAVAAALALSGCGEEERRLPSACDDGPQAVTEALSRAPGPVALEGGTRLSTCVRRARTHAEVQAVGALYTTVADRLADRVARSDTAALRLGYLIAATRRGARRTGGIHEELVRRLEQSAGLDGVPPERRTAFRRGLDAGRRHG